MDVLDFQPLYTEETEDAIRARWNAWANDGLTADDVDLWTDVRETTFFWVATTPGIRESAREYDLMGSEVPASSMPQWSWGIYLDGIAESRGERRLPATFSTGAVTFTGSDGVVIPAGTTVGVEPVTAADDPPQYETTTEGTISGGTLTRPIRALRAGRDGDVSAGAVKVLLTPIPGVDPDVVNVDPVVGGTDEETDESLRQKVVTVFAGAAAANQLYYRRIARSVPGVGRVTVIPAADGPGTITIIVSTAEGGPVSSDTLAAAQALLDPVAGQGAGAGQVGATITVKTTTTMPINPAATIEFETGYSLLGGSGTVPLQGPIEAAMAAYIDSVQSGQEVVRTQLVGRVVALPGVHDMSVPTLNGAAANLTVPVNPPQIPTLGSTVGIVEGSV